MLRTANMDRPKVIPGSEGVVVDSALELVLELTAILVFPGVLSTVVVGLLSSVEDVPSDVVPDSDEVATLDEVAVPDVVGFVSE